jgi:hypothetical protein
MLPGRSHFKVVTPTRARSLAARGYGRSGLVSCR